MFNNKHSVVKIKVSDIDSVLMNVYVYYFKGRIHFNLKCTRVKSNITHATQNVLDTVNSDMEAVLIMLIRSQVYRYGVCISVCRILK